MTVTWSLDKFPSRKKAVFLIAGVLSLRGWQTQKCSGFSLLHQEIAGSSVLCRQLTDSGLATAP